MNSPFLAQLIAEPWAMEPKALEAFLARVRDGYPADNRGALVVDGKAHDWGFINDLTLTTDSSNPVSIFGDDAPKRSRMTVSGGVARIPISGVLLKRVPAWLRWFGVDATSYSDITDDVHAALADDGVKEIVLAVDSPGGQVAGVHEAGEAILAARQGSKRITAEVGDLCASAAYWLSSQANRMTAGVNAQIGSIGVYSVYVDSSKAAADEGFKVHVISSGPHKGAGVPGAPITQTQLDGFQAVIDGMAQNFKDSVARGRGRAKKDVDEWATGQVWLAAEAARMGLIDGITATRNQGPAGGPSAASESHCKEDPMDPKQIAADQEKIRSEAAATERAAEKQRVADIRAAFPKDPAFAMDQIAAGASLSDAKAAYADVLQAKLDASEKQLSEAKAKPAAAPAARKGADPLSTEDTGNAAGGKVDFLSRAREMAVEKGWTVRQSLSYLARTEPSLYADFMNAAGAGAILERRRIVDAAGKGR